MTSKYASKYVRHISPELLDWARKYYRRERCKFTNGSKLAKALGIDTRMAGSILRALGMKFWTDAKTQNSKRVFVVPKELRQ